MGNGPSIAELPPEWEDILPNITRDEIVCSSRKKCRVEADRFVYLDDDLFDLDEHVPMALAILRAHPHLKDIRFKLVPGKMTEETYWAALFGILHDGGINIDHVVGKIDDDYETGGKIGGVNDDTVLPPMAQSLIEQPDKTKNGKLIRTPIAKLERAYYDDDGVLESNADATKTHPFYFEEIKEQQAHIALLQKSLREANHKTRKLALELHKERRKRDDKGASEGGDDGTKDHSGIISSCPRCNSALPSQQSHKGNWEMHPDCKEFMKLDDDLKGNLRKEKEKRLGEVLSQMKFILDTDDIKDSYGSWSCCGEEKYEADGCV